MTVSHHRLRTIARAAALATASLLLAPSAFAQAFDAVRLYAAWPRAPTAAWPAWR